MAEIKRLVDAETGEIHERAAILGDGDRITSAKQRAEYARIKAQEASGRGVEFTITNMNNIDEVIEKVSDKHCGYLLYLQCFVNYDAILENPNPSCD